jgi:hypothetical protein
MYMYFESIPDRYAQIVLVIASVEYDLESWLGESPPKIGCMSELGKKPKGT